MVVVSLATVVGFGADLAVVESETVGESTVVTSQAGTVTSPGDDLVLAVPGDDRFGPAVERPAGSAPRDF